MPQPSADELAKWDRHHLWHSFTQMATYESLLVEGGDGCYLVTNGGRRLLDGASSMWCAAFGHRHPRIDAAIRVQLDQIAQVTSLGMASTTAVRLARRLAELAPGNLEHVFLASDGSSAVEVAMKMAFQYWHQRPQPQLQRTKFLAIGEAYHGDTLGAAALGGIDRFHSLFEPLLFEVIRIPCPDPRTLPAGMSAVAASEHFLSQAQATIADYADQLVAVVAEPLVQFAAGMVMHPPGYLAGLAELVREQGLLLILDEVACGLGRTGELFACNRERVVPDFLCLGKALSGGYLPVSATLTHHEIWQAFLGPGKSERTLNHGHTFSGNPLGAAASLAALDLLTHGGLLAELPATVDYFHARWNTLAKHCHVSQLRTCGMVAALDVAGDDAPGRRVARVALEHGVWLRPQSNFVYAASPLVIEPAEIDILIDAIGAGLTAIE